MFVFISNNKAKRIQQTLKFIHYLSITTNSHIQLKVKKMPLKTPSIGSSSSDARRKKNVQKKQWMFNGHVCVQTGKEMLLKDNLKVRIYDWPVCLLTAREILRQVNLKVRICDWPICLLTAREILLQDSVEVRLYDRSICLQTTIEILLQESLRLQIYIRPICLLTTIEILPQDSLKLRIFDRSTCLLIGSKLRLQENKIHQKDSILGEMLIKHSIALIKLMKELKKYSLVHGSFSLRFPKDYKNDPKIIIGERKKM